MRWWEVALYLVGLAVFFVVFLNVSMRLDRREAQRRVASDAEARARASRRP